MHLTRQLVEPSTYTLEALRWFVRSAEAGSLTRAATRAHVAQSTVSRAIARLERTTGLQLFYRTGRSFGLTEAGTHLLPRAQVLLKDLEALTQTVAEAHGAVRGLVRVNLCRALGRYVLTPALLGWARKHEEVSLELSFGEREIDPRVTGVDLVVRAGRPRDSEVHRTALGSYGHVLVAASSWVKRHGLPENPIELEQLPTVAMRLERVWSTWQFHRGAKVARVVTAPRISVTDADALVVAVREGLGATVLPDFLAQALIEGRELVRLCVAWDIPRMPVFAFHEPRRRLPRLAREALDVLARLLPRG